MRKAASKLRREERAAKRAVKKRVATANKRLAAQRKHVAAKVARKAKPSAATRIMEGLKDAATFIATDGKEGGNIVAGIDRETGDWKLHHAILESLLSGEQYQMQRQNDDIVCSLMSVIVHAHDMPHHAPWTISAAECRAIMEVLERAGYSAHGRRTNALAGDNAKAPSEVAKAS